MPDNLKRRQPEDPNFINTSQAWEVQYWCGKFGITKQQLVTAVKAVGPSVAKVKKQIGK